MAEQGIDFSSGAIPVSNGQLSVPQGNLYNDPMADFQRSWLGSALTGTYRADYQDWMRSEQSALNQWYRDIASQNMNNAFNANEAEKSRAFNASEAQKQRDFEEHLRDTAISAAMADAKAAGLNPVMYFANNGAMSASSPSGSAASSSPARSSGSRAGGSNYQHRASDSSDALVGALLKFAGEVMVGKVMSESPHRSYTNNYNGHVTYNRGNFYQR